MSLIPIVQGGHSSASAFDSTLIGNSVWFDGSADHLIRSPTSHSSNEVVMACWFQRTSFSDSIRGIMSLGSDANVGSTNTGIWLASNDTLYFYNNGHGVVTNQLFRDIGWYHICASYKLDESTASNKGKLFINGEEVTSFSADPRSSWGTSFGSTANQTVGVIFGVNHYDGYIAQPVMLDGQSIQGGDVAITDFVDTFTFGTNGSQIVPKKNSDIAALATSAGGNSFCLDFANSSDLGNDISSNNKDLTPSSMSSANHSSNTPSKSYPILNVLDPTTATASNGNLNFAGPSADDKAAMRTTIGIPDNSGKFYFEYEMTGGSNDAVMIGIAGDGSANGGYDDWVQDITPQVAVYTESSGNVLYEDGSNTNSSFFGSSPTGGDVIGVAYDSDTRKVWFALNNTYAGSGDPAAGSGEAATLSSSGTAFPTVSARGSSDTLTLRFDSGDFTYSAPTGFNELNTANLTAPTYQGCDWFDAANYEGTGSEQAVGSGGSGSKFTALAWIKNRDAADDNIWMDRVIGTGGYLSTTQNDSGAAATSHGDGGSDILTSEAQAVKTFGQRSVTLGTMPEVNTSGESYVLWQWLIGDSATSAASITAGSPSLSTTGLVAEPGHFSIAQYTGNGTDNATFAHGLGATPNFVMVKRISGSATNSDWVIHIPGLGTENYIYPHYRIALSSGASINGMVPDANLVEISTGVATNTSGATHMAYSFKNTPGLCKIGTYTGNSSTDGTYVSTGFKPRFIWIFNTTLTSADAERPIFDTARYKFNGATTAGGSNGGVVFSDQRAAEEAQNTSLGVNPAIDILSDGFKLRANDSTINTGTTYLYISMADIAGNGTLPPVYGR